MSRAGHEDDPISAASSGLLALGVPSNRRMETLGLLGALLDLADPSGEVLLDSALMSTEERLGIDLCLEGYEWLERLGVIRRTWSGWVIDNFALHQGPIGATEAAMALLRRHVNAANEVIVSMPTRETPAAAATVTTLPTWRRRVPVMAASVAAGIAVLAGATQFVPQAAVSTHNAAVRTNGTASRAADVATSAATQATSAASTAATNALRTNPAIDAVTTTTSTTLLPSVPCLSDAINTLTSRSGLGLNTRTSTDLPPGVLPCP